MKKIIISIAAVLLMGCSSWVVNSVSESNPLTPLTMSVKNRLLIPSDDGQQGVATDGEFIYVQNSQQLFKYLLNGKLIKKGPRLELHHGGIVYVKGRVYAAVSGCDQNGSDEHFIHIYDANSLELISVHDVGKHFSVCAGGITHRDGHFFVAESFFDDDHSDRIVEFDAAFGHIKTHEINFKSPFGIQGLEFLPDRNQFQVHSHGKAFYRINGRLESNSLIIGQSKFELQDVARLDCDTLIINHRDAQSLEFIELKN